MNRQLQVIKKKFPEQSDRIQELFETNEDFRTLCSDLFLCLQHLQKFKKEFDEMRLSIEEYKNSIKEYKNISVELENELSHFILEINK